MRATKETPGINMLRILCLAALLVASAPARADTPQWPTAAFANPGGLDGVQLSPDGTRLVATVVQGERRALLTQKLDGSERQVAFVLDKPDMDLELVRWIGNERLLLRLTHNNPGHIDGLVVPVTRLMSLKRDGGEQKLLSELWPQQWINHAAREAPSACPGADSVLVGSSFGERGELGVNHYRYSDKPLPVREVVAPGLGERWWADAKGRVRVLETRKNGQRRWQWRPLAEGDDMGPWVDVPLQPASADWQVLGFDADPQQLLFVAPAEVGLQVQALALTPAGGPPRRLAQLPQAADAGDLRLLRNASTCAAVGVHFGTATLAWGDDLEGLLGGIRQALPDTEVQLQQWLGGPYLVRVAGVSRSPEWLVGDRQAGTLKAVAAPYSLLPASLELQETRLPSGARLLRAQSAPGKRPVVVCIECELRENEATSGFAPLAAFLAHRGHAVLMLTPRDAAKGSVLSNSQATVAWIERQVQSLAELPDAANRLDLTRLALVAKESQAYTGLRWARDRPQPLNVIVGIGALTDLLAYRANALHDNITASSREAMLSQIDHLRGEHLLAASIAQHASKLRAPTLLLHGDHDPWLNMVQAHSLIKGLAEAKLPHRLLQFKRSSSQPLHPPYRLQAYEAIETWLAQHL